MSFYIGWVLIALTVILVALLIFESSKYNKESQEKFVQSNRFLILTTAGCYVLGCAVLVLNGHSMEYLNLVNIGMSGKFITTMFTGRVWR